MMFKDYLKEKTLTPAELKKREEIAKAMEKDEPSMSMGKKMAIATAVAKRVAESLADDMLAIAKKHNPNAKMAGSVEQQKKERDDMLKKRDAANAGKPKSKHQPFASDWDFGKNQGYGQGHYMGDSVEYNEAENPFQTAIDAMKAKEKQTDDDHAKGLKDIETKFNAAEKLSSKEFTKKLHKKLHKEDIDEATGDKKFDNILKTIVKDTKKQSESDKKALVKAAFNAKFGSGRGGLDSLGIMKKGLEESAQHKVTVTVSDPNHTMVTKRKEQVLKRVIVNADDKNHAVVKATEFYKKKGYKVHDAEYHSPQPKSSMKTESVKEAFADQGIAEGYAMDDIAVGGTVIYKSLDGHYKMSKVRGKGLGMSLQLMNGARIQNAAVVSTDQSDWSQYKDAKTPTKKQGVAEGGPFSYGKPPRKGSVAANAEQKRKEQDRKTPAIEPKDQRVGNAKITKGVMEEVELEEANFADTMKKAIDAHERGDHKRAKYHLDNAKTAQYALKSTEISKHKDLLDKYKKLRDIHEQQDMAEGVHSISISQTK